MKNFFPIELIPLNLPLEEGQHLAHLFGCKLAQLPLKYLGVPLSNKKITTAQWGFVLDKYNTKLQNWVGSLLSIGGRIMLINALVFFVLVQITRQN